MTLPKITEAEAAELLGEIPTRDDLHENPNAKIVIDRLDHEEYLLYGIRYFCGWQSPQKKAGIKGGWVTYRSEPDPAAEIAKLRQDKAELLAAAQDVVKQAEETLFRLPADLSDSINVFLKAAIAKHRKES